MKKFNNPSHLSVDIHYNDDFTVASVRGKAFTGRGAAKRHPDDRKDPVIGARVALSRALRDLADQVDEQAKMEMGNGLSSVALAMKRLDKILRGDND